MDSGKCPVEDFLDSLPVKHARKVTWVMQLIEELDIIPVKYFKKLVGTDGLWEIRVQSGGNIYRILCFFDGDNLVIVNHAFQKKTQKTPKKEIEIAAARKKSYQTR